jgi:choline dehydrogenase-like flavoprotein
LERDPRGDRHPLRIVVVVPRLGARRHRGLFVVDASVLPGAVVAHPTMTIMAQALKAMKAALP